MRDNAAQLARARREGLELPARQAAARRSRTSSSGAREELRRLLKERADAGRLKLGIESLEGVLGRTGGAIYPKTSLVENVEFFLVAAIVILGIRTYFVQPFKIPTNSMWPTYYGMTAENLPPGVRRPEPRRGALQVRRVRRQAPHRWWPRGTARSPSRSSSGRDKPSVAYTLKDGRSWLVFPARVKEYTFYVDGEPAVRAASPPTSAASTTSSSARSSRTRPRSRRRSRARGQRGRDRGGAPEAGREPGTETTRRCGSRSAGPSGPASPSCGSTS